MTTWKFRKGDAIFDPEGYSYKVEYRMDNVDEDHNSLYYVVEIKKPVQIAGTTVVLEKSDVEDDMVHSDEVDKGNPRTSNFNDGVQKHSLDAEDVQEYLDES